MGKVGEHRESGKADKRAGVLVSRDSGLTRGTRNHPGRLPLALVRRGDSTALRAARQGLSLTTMRDAPLETFYPSKAWGAGVAACACPAFDPTPGTNRGAWSRWRSIRTDGTVARGTGAVAEIGLDCLCSRVPAFPPCSLRVPSCPFPRVPSYSLVFPPCSHRVP
jgi:hypothetical protein